MTSRARRPHWQFPLLASFTLAAILACSTFSAPTSTPDSAPLPSSTPTSPPTSAATSTPTQTAPPTPSPTLTPPPASTAGVTRLAGPQISFNGMSFDLYLAEAVYVRLPDSQGDVDGHTVFAFAPQGLCREVGCVEVYPVASFAGAIPGGREIMLKLWDAVNGDPTSYFPTWGAAILIQADTVKLQFEGMQGLRAVVMRGQAAYPADHDSLIYEFNGLTVDGRYYVVVTVPLDIPILGDGPILPADPQEQSKFITEYNSTVQSQLDTLPSSEFLPDLQWCDALAESVRIGSYIEVPAP